MFLIAGLLTLLIFSSITIGAGVGANKVGIGELIGLLHGEATEWATNVILNLRLPRTLLAILVGAALGVAGLILQTAVRNPLAEPGLRAGLPLHRGWHCDWRGVHRADALCALRWRE